MRAPDVAAATTEYDHIDHSLGTVWVYILVEYSINQKVTVRGVREYPNPIGFRIQGLKKKGVWKAGFGKAGFGKGGLETDPTATKDIPSAATTPSPTTESSPGNSIRSRYELTAGYAHPG